MIPTKLEVLLIEDDETDFIGLKRGFSLSNIRCNLHIAKTGEEGLQLLSEMASDDTDKVMPIVLLDINLPIQSGIETLELIRKNSKLQKVPVFIWSNIKDEKQYEAVSNLDIEGFMLKSEMGSSYVKAATVLDDYWKLEGKFN